MVSHNAETRPQHGLSTLDAVTAPAVPNAPSRRPHTLGNIYPGLSSFWYPVARAGAPGSDGPWPLLGRSWRRSEVADVAERFGLVWVAPEHARAPLPEVPDDHDDRFVRVPSPPRSWHAGAAQMTDNFCDLGHLPFVHVTSFADPDDTLIPRLDAETAETGFTLSFSHRTRRLHGDGTGRRVFRLTYRAPFSVVLRLEYLDDDAVITSGFFHQPVDADTTTLWAVNWRDDIVDGRCTQAATTAFQELVGGEDRAMLERFPDHEMPLDLTTEVHTRADRPTVELRRILARLLPPGPVPPPPIRVLPAHRAGNR